MLVDGQSLRFHALFLSFLGKVSSMMMKRSDDDARMSRDAYDTKIGLFWVELAKKKPTGESGVKNHARGRSPRSKRLTFRAQTQRKGGRSQQILRRAAVVVLLPSQRGRG